MTEPLWRDLTHQQVWDQVHAGPGPYASDGAATAWSNAQAALRQIDSDLGAAITRAVGWTGPAADATRSGLTPLGGWAVDATGSAGRAAASLTEHQEQVAWVRANLPEPSLAAALEPPIPLSDAGVDPAVLQNWTVTVGRNTALAGQAFHVMDTYAANTALIQQQVPIWTPPPAVTMSVADRPGRPPMAVEGGRVNRFATAVAPTATRVPTPAPPPTATPSSAGALAPTARGGAAGANAAGSAATGGLPTEPGVVGGLPAGPGVLGVLPAEPGVLGGLPGGVVPAGGVPPAGPPGRPNTTPPNTAALGPSRTTPGVPRGLPDGDGVLRGSPSTPLGSPLGQGSSTVGLSPHPGPGPGPAGSGGGGTDGGARPGGRTEPGAGVFGGQPSNTESAIRGDPAASGPARSAAERSPGYLPMGGAGLGSRGEAYRRPEYLVDSWGFFVDDRHIQGPLIIPELHPRPREASIG